MLCLTCKALVVLMEGCTEEDQICAKAAVAGPQQAGPRFCIPSPEIAGNPTFQAHVVLMEGCTEEGQVCAQASMAAPG